MVFRIHVRVLQVAVANGHTAVERELRRFLKVRNAKYNNGVGYLYYGSKTTHFGVRGGGGGWQGVHATLPQTGLQMSTHFIFYHLFLYWQFVCAIYELVRNIGFQVSDRQCCPLISFFFPLLLFLTAHGRNSLRRSRNSDLLQPASEKKRKKTQNRSGTVQLFKAGILDLDGKLPGNTPSWRVQRK